MIKDIVDKFFFLMKYNEYNSNFLYSVIELKFYLFKINLINVNFVDENYVLLPDNFKSFKFKS